MHNDISSDYPSSSRQSLSRPSDLPIPTYRLHRDLTLILPSSPGRILLGSLLSRPGKHMALRVSYLLEAYFSFPSNRPAT
jgi:hypothetical protein